MKVTTHKNCICIFDKKTTQATDKSEKRIYWTVRGEGCKTLPTTSPRRWKYTHWEKCEWGINWVVCVCEREKGNPRMQCANIRQKNVWSLSLKEPLLCNIKPICWQWTTFHNELQHSINCCLGKPKHEYVPILFVVLSTPFYTQSALRRLVEKCKVQMERWLGGAEFICPVLTTSDKPPYQRTHIEGKWPTTIGS